MIAFGATGKKVTVIALQKGKQLRGSFCEMQLEKEFVLVNQKNLCLVTVNVGFEISQT